MKFDCGLRVCSVVRCNPCKGARVDFQGNQGWTALLYASRNGHADVVELLLKAGEMGAQF